MDVPSGSSENKKLLDQFVSGYARFLLALLVIIPLVIISYIDFHQNPALLFTLHSFHLFLIFIAIFLGAFISYLTWQCYLVSGELFLRWLALGLLGFTLVYAPHGLLSPFKIENTWLFLLYGPAARVVMALCFLIAVFHYGRDIVSPEHRHRGWMLAIGVFMVIDILIALLANSVWRDAIWLRLAAEYLAIAIYLISVCWMLLRRIHGPLMMLYAIAMLWFAQSSLAFSLGSVWNHQWWLAHLIFAGGFLLLSYAVVQAYLTNGSFTRIYTQTELLGQVLAQQVRAETAIIKLQHVNSELERLASTDALTGAANRREFMARAEEETARATRMTADLSFLMLDLDHFKAVNDKYGHQAGDDILKSFVELTEEVLRPGDLLGRIGGEEFAILLPNTAAVEARRVAERLRSYIEQHVLLSGKDEVKLTISIGVAQYHIGTDSVKSLFQRADKLLYQAKNNGRNRVES